MRTLTSRTITQLAAASVIALLSLAPAVMAADDPVPSLEALASQMATTPDQHNAIAAHYREKAAAARAEAKKHRAMAVSYGNRTVGAATYMKTHCDQLVEAADKSATAYDAMAALHEEEAKKAAE